MGNSWEGWGIKNVKNDDLNNQHGGTILYNGNVMGKSIAMGDKPIWQSCNQNIVQRTTNTNYLVRTTRHQGFDS